MPYPVGYAPSQRFRVEQFLPVLERAGVPYRVEPFLDKATWLRLYLPGRKAVKAWGVIRGYLRRLYCVLFVAPRFEYVFIHREAAPLGPPFFEWMIARLLRKKLVYDFDDAIWIPATSQENKLVAAAKWNSKVRTICKWSAVVAAGNSYLFNWAKQWNPNVVVVPTCVDTEKRYNRMNTQAAAGFVTIGWTGSHSTMAYLNAVVPVLQKLALHFDGSNGTTVRFLIIADRPPSFSLDRMTYLPWAESSEIDDLLSIDIGIMPLKADAWSEGKCGFKLIQYLALGIPAVASPIGVNKNIVDNGVEGFLCQSPEEWEQALAQLITNASMRAQMGVSGRAKVVEAYSVQSQASAFIRLFA